jgi:hypothetical protein
MSESKDGGSAFPTFVREMDGYEAVLPVQGMSLRDYFAGQALSGHLASYTGEDCGIPPADRAAKWAYEYADAMLKARRA